MLNKCCVHLNYNSRAMRLLIVYFLLHTFFYFLNFGSKDINFMIRKNNKAISILQKKKKSCSF